MGEHILCAAVWVDDGKVYPHQPSNITTGVVVGGWRHHNCLATVHGLGVGRRAKRHQGFITSTGRYVGRLEAFTIAQAAGQLEGRHIHCAPELFSEDLYD